MGLLSRIVETEVVLISENGYTGLFLRLLEDLNQFSQELY